MLTEVSFPVRYAETDAQGVVYYANHLAWFELGYEALFAALGRPLELDRPQVLEATCRYHAPIRFGETVTVQSTPLRRDTPDLWIAHTIRVGQEIRAHGATLLANAGSLWAGPAPDAPERVGDAEELLPRGQVESFPLRVRYAETDPTRGVHFSRFFAWLEVGRIAFMNRIGLHYAQMETDGSPFVIAWAGYRSFAPLVFDDPLQIEVWVLQVRRQAFSLGFRIAREEGELAALGRSVQVFIDRAGRPASMPETARHLLIAAQGSNPVPEALPSS